MSVKCCVVRPLGPPDDPAGNVRKHFMTSSGELAKVVILDFSLVNKQASGPEGRMDVGPAGLAAFRRFLARNVVRVKQADSGPEVAGVRFAGDSCSQACVLIARSLVKPLVFGVWCS